MLHPQPKLWIVKETQVQNSKTRRQPTMSRQTSYYQDVRFDGALGNQASDPWTTVTENQDSKITHSKIQIVLGRILHVEFIGATMYSRSFCAASLGFWVWNSDGFWILDLGFLTSIWDFTGLDFWLFLIVELGIGSLQFLRGLGPCMCRIGLAPLPHVQATAFFFFPMRRMHAPIVSPRSQLELDYAFQGVIGTPYESKPLCRSCTSLQKNAQPRTPPITTLQTR